MKLQEVQEYLGKQVLVYAKGQEIWYGLAQDLVEVDGKLLIEVKGAIGYTFLPIRDVQYMIERARS